MNLPERTPDGHPQCWLLYSREPTTSDGVWLRRCNVFPSQAAAVNHLRALIGPDLAASLQWQPHVLFPELHVGRDRRGAVWFLEPAPLLGVTP